MQRTAERLHFRHFLAQTLELAGATIDDTNESPDFLCSLPYRKIGVELTEYIHGKKSYSQIGAEIVQAIEKLRGIELQGAAELRRYWKEHANQLGLPPFRAIGPIPDAVRKAYANKQ